MPQHIVQQGECISSIADSYGFYWETLWSHPENAQLASERKDPNVLLPGAVVHIPEKKLKEHPAQTEKVHKFVVKGAPALLRLRLLEEGQPRSNIRYGIVIDGTLFSGTTDADGRIQITIPPAAQKGQLILYVENGTEEYTLDLGHIDPVDETSGLRGRLHNLGYDIEPSGESGDRCLTGALSAFQRDHQLPVTGQPDQATTSKIKEIFGG